MGGRSSSSNGRLNARSGRSSDSGITNNSPFASREEIRAVERELNYQLPMGAERAVVISIANIDAEGYGDVEYDIDFRISYTDIDSDGISHTMYDTETETRTRRMKVRNR